MNRSISSALATGTATAAAILALAFIASGNAYADDITIDTTPFVSSMTRDEVSAQLKVPYPHGNPWSGQYNMFQIKSAATSDQVSSEYTSSRDEVRALTGEDSGSAYFVKSAASFGSKVGGMMGGPAR
jgi:phosphoribosylformylglycinamidine (FGAM) synthase-like amidotransferase family enzyme